MNGRFLVNRGDAKILMNRITRRLRIPCQQNAGYKEYEHHRPNRPAVLLVLYHPAEVIGEPGADGKDRQHLEEI